MRKASYNYYGHLSLGGQIALLMIFCIVLIVGILFWNSTEVQQKRSLIFFMLSCTSIIYWIAKNLVSNLKRLEIKNGELWLTHLISKKVQKIDLNELAGFRINGLTLSMELMDLEAEVIASVYHPFYKDLNAFFLEMNVRQMGMDERYVRAFAI